MAYYMQDYGETKGPYYMLNLGPTQDQNYTPEKYVEQIQRAQSDPNGFVPMVSQKSGPSVWDTIKDTYFSGNYWKRFGQGADAIVDGTVNKTVEVVDKVADSPGAMRVLDAMKETRNIVWGVGVIVLAVVGLYVFAKLK